MSFTELAISANQHRLLSPDETQKRIPYPPSTRALRVSQGLFPRPVKLGARSVAWPEHEIEALISARIASQSEEEIRELVSQLMRERASSAALRYFAGSSSTSCGASSDGSTSATSEAGHE